MMSDFFAGVQMGDAASYARYAVLGLGGYSFVRFLMKTVFVLLQTFVLSGTSLKKYGSRNGSWAVVTGATDGIGKEFALQLAKAGFSIVLVSRSEEKLASVAGEIGMKRTYKVATRSFGIDFSAPLESDYEALADLVRSLDVGLLVNNVGRSHELPVAFATTPLLELKAIVDINVSATLRVTRIVLPCMLERRRGLVITLSSFAGNIPSPLLAVYSGSKAFLQTWSDALQAELAGTGVDVECLSTYFVVSNMSRIRRSSALIPMPREYVQSALRKIGLPCGALWTGRSTATTPYWSHSLLDYLIGVIGWKSAFIRYTLALHKDIRRRALRKLSATSKAE